MNNFSFATMFFSGWAGRQSVAVRWCVLVIFMTLTINETLAFAKSECDPILQFGIYDLQTKESEETFIQKTIDFLEKRKYQSFEQAKSDARNLGIETDYFSLDYGQKDASSSKSRVDDYLKDLRSSDTDIGKNLREYNKKASSTIVKAWEKCVTNKSGLVVWAVRVDEKNFQLKAASYPQGATHGKYFFSDITATPADCVKKGNYKKGDLLPEPDLAFVWDCSQDASKNISIILYAHQQGDGGKKHPVSSPFILKPLPSVPVGIVSGAQRPVCADVATVVMATYKHILKRTDNQKDGFWKVSRQLKEHEITVRDLVKTLASGQEFDNRVFSDKNPRNRAKLLYPILLGREASESDADHHAAVYGNMETKDIVAKIVADNSEYATRYGRNVVPENPPAIAYCE